MMAQLSVKRSVPLWLVLLTCVFVGLLIMAISLAMRSIYLGDNAVVFVSGFVFEVAKALFIGGTAGFIVKHFFEAVHQEPQVPSELGVERLFAGRSEAADVMLDQINDRSNRKVILVGISLRDFFTEARSMYHLWEAAAERVYEEEQRALPAKERFSLQILMLHPYSSEGNFRQLAEFDRMPSRRHQLDVETGKNTIEDFLDSRSHRLGDDNQLREFIQLRFYNHGSFYFCCLTDQGALIEPYSYRDQSKTSSPFPLIQVDRRSDLYDQIYRTVSTIWENDAKPVFDLDREYPGIFSSASKVRLTNIFCQDHRNVLGC